MAADDITAKSLDSGKQTKKKRKLEVPVAEVSIANAEAPADQQAKNKKKNKQALAAANGHHESGEPALICAHQLELGASPLLLAPMQLCVLCSNAVVVNAVPGAHLTG